MSNRGFWVLIWLIFVSSFTICTVSADIRAVAEAHSR